MSENSRLSFNKVLRPMLIKDILYDYTDENHFLTSIEIVELMKEKYDILTTRQTVYADIGCLIDAGYDIECVKRSQNQYHVVSRLFELAELKMLIDAVESSKSLTNVKSRSFAKKIASLASEYQADYLIPVNESHSKNKTDNNKVVYIVSAINDGMSKKRQIMFKYAERLSSGELQPKNNGSDYYVSPYRLCWKGDTYYLIGYSEKHKRIVTFRVDRICDIPLVIKQDIIPEPEDFQVNDYLNDSFRMSGDEASVEIVFSQGVGIMDNIIDRFGDDFSILSEDEDMCHAVINTPVNNAFFAWVFGFGGKVKIKGPHDVLYRYIRMVAAEMARL